MAANKKIFIGERALSEVAELAGIEPLQYQPEEPRADFPKAVETPDEANLEAVEASDEE